MEDVKQAQWFVYLVSCADNTLYTGVTTDCSRRESEHNGLLKGGARYTQARRPVKMLWFECCDNRSLACKREAAIKKLSRKQKLQIIETSNGVINNNILPH